MSEVKRWKLKGFLPGVEGECKAVFQPTVVMAEDFDNATRLFLDAAERCVASERREKELQRRLTAADERADVLEGELRELLAGTGNSPGANRKYGRARDVLAGSQKQASPEPYQGIPGTSFQRLNALANQGE